MILIAPPVGVGAFLQEAGNAFRRVVHNITQLVQLLARLSTHEAGGVVPARGLEAPAEAGEVDLGLVVVDVGCYQVYFLNFIPP